MLMRQSASTFIPLFLVLIIEEMGMGLLLPVMSVLFLDPSSSMLPLTTSLVWRDFLYGLTLVIFFFFMFFGAPILGDLSDKYGRKKILILCLSLTCVSYLISAAGVYHNNVWLLLFGRALAGFMAGSLPIAQAAIADISTPEDKAKNLSLITLASCLGFVIGPLMGGYFSESDLFSWFNLQTPFYIAAALALLNAVCLSFTFNETHYPKENLQIRFAKGVDLFISAFRNKQIRFVSILFLLLHFAWGLYFQFISLYFVQTYNFSALKIGIFMGYLGAIFVISLLYVIRLYLRFLSVSSANCVALGLTGVSILINVIFPIEWVQWLSAIPAASSVAIAYTCQLTLFSDSADSESQGWVMGISAAVMAAAWVLGGLLTSSIGLLHLIIPFFISGVVMLFAAWLQLRRCLQQKTT